LLVGMTAAKALAAAWNKPLIPVNHLEAHLYANAVNGPLVYPGLALLVSGGHTAIWRWDGPDRLVLLGETRDDAAGEALDKGARLLGLPYPGGPALEALAATARSRDDHRLPVARLEAGTYDFSFSGLKTALAQALGRSPDRPEEWAWALQEAVVEALWQRTREAWTRYPVEHLYLAGGVVANRRLRERFEHWTSMVGIQLHLPPLAYCTDNAVMVAAAAAHTGHPADLGIGPRVLFPLGSAAAENI
jgi:N6-L-threonylcarbamoyladenine synthase